MGHSSMNTYMHAEITKEERIKDTNLKLSATDDLLLANNMNHFKHTPQYVLSTIQKMSINLSDLLI